MTTLDNINELLQDKDSLSWEDDAVAALNEYYDKMNNPDDMIYNVDDEIIENYLIKELKEYGVFTLKSTLADIQDGSLYIRIDAYGRLKSVDTDDLAQMLEWASEELSR